MKKLSYSFICFIIIIICCNHKQEKKIIPVYSVTIPDEYVCYYYDNYDIDSLQKSKFLFGKANFIKVIVHKNDSFFYQIFFSNFSFSQKSIDSFNTTNNMLHYLRSEYSFVCFFDNKQKYILFNTATKNVEVYNTNQHKLISKFKIHIEGNPNPYNYFGLSLSINERFLIQTNYTDKVFFWSLETGKQIKKDSIDFYQNKYYGIYYDTLANKIKYIINGKIAETINNSRIKNLVQLTFKHCGKTLFKGDKPFIEFDSIDVKGISHLLFFDNTTPAFRFLSTTSDSFCNLDSNNSILVGYWECEKYVYLIREKFTFRKINDPVVFSSLFDVFENSIYDLKKNSFWGNENFEIEKNGDYFLTNQFANHINDTIDVNIFDIKKGITNKIRNCNLHKLWIPESEVVHNLENEKLNNNFNNNRFFINGKSKQLSLADNGFLMSSNYGDTLYLWDIITPEQPIKKIVITNNQGRHINKFDLFKFHLDKTGEYILCADYRISKQIPFAKISTKTGEVILEKVYNSLPELLERINKENRKK